MMTVCWRKDCHHPDYFCYLFRILYFILIHFMNRKSKFVLVFIFGFVLSPASGLTQPDIPINPDLKSNCASWKIKVKQNGIWGKKPAMISFGQLKTISTETEKSGQSSKQV